MTSKNAVISRVLPTQAGTVLSPCKELVEQIDDIDRGAGRQGCAEDPASPFCHGSLQIKKRERWSE